MGLLMAGCRSCAERRRQVWRAAKQGNVKGVIQHASVGAADMVRKLASTPRRTKPTKRA